MRCLFDHSLLPRTGPRQGIPKVCHGTDGLRQGAYGAFSNLMTVSQPHTHVDVKRGTMVPSLGIRIGGAKIRKKNSMGVSRLARKAVVKDLLREHSGSRRRSAFSHWISHGIVPASIFSGHMTIPKNGFATRKENGVSQQWLDHDARACHLPRTRTRRQQMPLPFDM